MGYFEDKLSALGRSLDAGAAWVSGRCRALGDRRRHAHSFDAIRDRMDRATRAARDKAELAGDAARERWARHDVDAGSLRRAGALLGVLTLVVLLGMGLRALTAPSAPTLTRAEIDAIRALGERSLQTDADIAPGMRDWFQRP